MAYPINKEYYTRRKPEILKDFKKEAQIWKPVITEHYGQETADSIYDNAWKEIKAMIQQIPYIGGDENPGTRWLLASVRSLALYKAMKKHGKTAEEAGKALYDAILTQVGQPSSEQSTQEQLSEQYRKAAEQSQERRYPEDFVFEYVPGNGIEFDRGFDFTECAALKFYHTQDADEFMPFYCYLDFPKSKIIGTGFSRTMTLAEGNNKCNHRIKTGGDTQCAWPPPFMKNRSEKTGGMEI